MLKCPKCGNDVAMPADPRALSTECGKCSSKVDLSSMRTMADAPAPPPPPGGPDGLPAGKILSGYRIEQVLGRGGMAVVYKAVQLSLSRAVAIKTLPRHLATNPAFVARFTREAGALASLSHANIIGIIDRGSEGDLYYFVMEFADGTDLQEVIARKRPAPGEAVRIVTQVLSALEYAHRRGVIHRDIKPGNIMMTTDGAVKVTDFGIAHLAGGMGTSLGLTMAGAQMGTVNYMAPEQRVDAGKVDARADLYAVGVVLYELLTGQLPLGAFEPASRLNPQVDPRLDAVIQKALKPDPNARWTGAADMAAALAPLAGAAPPPPADPKAPEPPATSPCPFCKSVNRSDARFCLDCGKTLIETCPKCTKAKRAESKFCDSCGTNVSEWAENVRAEAEKRFKDATRLEKEGRLSESLAELNAVMAAEGKELDELRSKAKAQRERVLAAKEKQDEAFRKGQEAYDLKDFESAVAAWVKLPGSLSHVRDAMAEAQKKILARDGAIRDAGAAQTAGRWEDALASWERAVALSANSDAFRPRMEIAREKAGEIRFAALTLRASQTTAARDWAGAVAAWSEALKIRPRDASATAGLHFAESQKRAADRDAAVANGADAASAGRKKEAVESWERALALLGPEDAALRANLDAKIRDARASLAAERQKMLVIAGIGGAALLFVTVVIVVLVLAFGKGCESNSGGSGGGGGGNTPSAPAVPSSPDELFDAFKRGVKAGEFDRLWDLNSRSTKAQSSRQQMEIGVRGTFQPYRPDGLNADLMQKTHVETYGDKAEFYYSYQGQDVGDPLFMIKEDGGWKFGN